MLFSALSLPNRLGLELCNPVVYLMDTNRCLPGFLSMTSFLSSLPSGLLQATATTATVLCPRSSVRASEINYYFHWTHEKPDPIRDHMTGKVRKLAKWQTRAPCPSDSCAALSSLPWEDWEEIRPLSRCQCGALSLASSTPWRQSKPLPPVL